LELPSGLVWKPVSIFTKSLEDINELDLKRLVEQQLAEWKTIEYKESLSVDTDSAKKKFLSQVSSFANAVGGHLIYGIRAKNGVPAELCGQELENADGSVLRLEDILRTGIRPRIPGVLIRAVPMEGDKFAIVIRVPKSWYRPHQVVFNNEFRFYSRASNGKYLIDVDELRSVFALSETAADRIRNFRANRLAQIVADDTPDRLEANPKLVLHFVPLSAFAAAAKVDLRLLQDETSLTKPMRAAGWDGPRYNFDGIYTSARHDGVSYSYVQVFRNGSIEGVNTSLLDPKFAERKIIPSVAYEATLRKLLQNCLEIARKLGVEPPAVVMLSFLGINGYEMAVSPTRYYDGGHPIDRNDLIVPEALVENFEASVDKPLRTIVDPVWNAAGWPHSINFDEEDNWKPHES
jgi:schlafen family protein